MATAITGAIAIGLVVVTATVLLADLLKGGAYADDLTLRLYLLFGGTLGGILAAAGAAWRLLQPIPSLYRRGGLAIVSAFATVLLMLVCIPIHQMFGQAGLLVTMALSGIAAALLAARTRRLARNA
ncbi:MAG TPA: hypothetical protein VE399_10990 [Gemmatimonadales bacterium]|nr:hypothetical protein [Gemmatimonadales bacterium]